MLFILYRADTGSTFTAECKIYIRSLLGMRSAILRLPLVVALTRLMSLLLYVF